MELADLAEHRRLTQEEYEHDRNRRRIVERIVEDIANAVIDMGKILLAASDPEMPSTYRDVLHRLSAIGIVDSDRASALAELAVLRNALAHRYLDFRWSQIKRFLDEGYDHVTSLLEVVEARLQSEMASGGDGG